MRYLILLLLLGCGTQERVDTRKTKCFAPKPEVTIVEKEVVVKDTEIVEVIKQVVVLDPTVVETEKVVVQQQVNEVEVPYPVTEIVETTKVIEVPVEVVIPVHYFAYECGVHVLTHNGQLYAVLGGLTPLTDSWLKVTKKCSLRQVSSILEVK